MKKLFYVVLFLCTTAIHAADIYVDINATGANDGSNWTDALTDLQAGLNAAAANDHVFVATGTYVGNFVINSPIEVTGGFPTGGGTQNSANNPTILDANNSGRVLKINGNDADVVTLQGLIVKRGLINENFASDKRGAGIYSMTKLVLIESVVDRNDVRPDGLSVALGGGIMIQSDLVVIKSRISFNDVVVGGDDTDANVTAWGGGIYSTGHVTLVNSTVSSNLAYAIKDSNNEAYARGGGIYAADGVSLTNSTVMNNTAQSYTVGGSGSNDGNFIIVGGGVSTGSAVQVVSSTITGNRIVGDSSFSPPCLGFGGGVQTSSSLTLENSVIWGNVLQDCPDGTSYDDEMAVSGTVNSNKGFVKCGGVALGSIDGGSCDVDPMFGSGYRLSAGSPLIDAGDTNALPMDTHDVDGDGDDMEVHPLDSDNMKRVSGNQVDIGAYEFQQVYFIGGTVTGLLAGNSMVVTNNMTEDLSVEADGPFVFTAPVETGMMYDVTISQPPNNPIQPCMITNETGLVTNADISDIEVTCELGTDLIFRDGF